MKILVFIFLIYSSVGFSANIEERIKALSLSGDITDHMLKCGYTDRNMDQFKKDLKINEDLVKIDCLESKKEEVDSDEQTRLQTIINKKAARQRLKDFNCSSLSGFLKDICILRK